MIIFTVTNNKTGQVYVGSTRNELADQWGKMVSAALQNMDFPLYQEIRTHGEESFTVEEWDAVEDRKELNALMKEALDTLNARSLNGYKTSNVIVKPTKRRAAPKKSKIEKELLSIIEAEAVSSDDWEELELTPETKTTEAEKEAAKEQIEQPIVALVTEPTTGTITDITPMLDAPAVIEAVEQPTVTVVEEELSEEMLAQAQRMARIQEAVMRSREMRQQKSADAIASERAQLEQMLAQLTDRAEQIFRQQVQSVA